MNKFNLIINGVTFWNSSFHPCRKEKWGNQISSNVWMCRKLWIVWSDTRSNQLESQVTALLMAGKLKSLAWCGHCFLIFNCSVAKIMRWTKKEKTSSLGHKKQLNRKWFYMGRAHIKGKCCPRGIVAIVQLWCLMLTGMSIHNVYTKFILKCKVTTCHVWSVWCIMNASHPHPAASSTFLEWSLS